MTHFRYFAMATAFIAITSTSLQAAETIVLSTHLTPGNFAYKSTEAILSEAFRRNGLVVKLKHLPGERALIEANTGVTDGEAHRIYDIAEIKKLDNLVRIPEVQQTIKDYAWSVNVQSLEDGWSSLKPYRVGVIRGSVFLTKMAKEHAKNVYEVPRYETLFKMLNGGRLDIVITAPSRAKKYEGDKIKKVEPALTFLPIYTYLHKKHKALAPKIASALHEMKTDGSYNKLLSDLQ